MAVHVHEFGKTGLAIVADKKAAYYLVIKNRWWYGDKKEWMYEGTVLTVADGGILKVFDNGQYIYSERALINLRGLSESHGLSGGLCYRGQRR